jgi:hypothetical protein
MAYLAGIPDSNDLKPQLGSSTARRKIVRLLVATESTVILV